jgi:predicted DNA-binding protein YlxM (UPF0122 family)
MPFKSEKIKLPEKYDRRVKLTTDQKTEIKKKYETGFYSLNSLAKEYNVSKKTILLIVNPESKRKNDKRIKEHWKEYSATPEERNATIREHRRYKQELFKSGKIK